MKSRRRHEQRITASGGQTMIRCTCLEFEIKRNSESEAQRAYANHVQQAERDARRQGRVARR